MSTKYLKRNSNPARNKELKVAQYANPKRKEHPNQPELDRRRKDWEMMKAARDHHNGPAKRMENGYHRPGSYQ